MITNWHPFTVHSPNCGSHVHATPASGRRADVALPSLFAAALFGPALARAQIEPILCSNTNTAQLSGSAGYVGGGDHNRISTQGFRTGNHIDGRSIESVGVYVHNEDFEGCETIHIENYTANGKTHGSNRERVERIPDNDKINKVFVGMEGAAGTNFDCSGARNDSVTMEWNDDADSSMSPQLRQSPKSSVTGGTANSRSNQWSSPRLLVRASE